MRPLMSVLTSVGLLSLSGCGGQAANQAWKAEQNAKSQQALAECDAGLERHAAYMQSMPPKAASGQVAEAWNVKQEAEIGRILNACKPAMRMGFDAKWFVAEVRQGEAFEKLMVEMEGYYSAVSPKEKPAVLRRLIDAIVQAKAHYGFAIDNIKSDPSIGAQNSGMLSKAQSRVPVLEAKYKVFKAIQAKQYE